MRVAMISDVHGNLVALERVLADLERDRPDQLAAFLIGFASQSTAEAYIHFADVHPAHRGKGIARRSYGMFFEEARRQDCRRVRCITSPVNTGSIAFHTSIGFEIKTGGGGSGVVSVHADYDDDGKEKVVFERTLR